MSLLEAARDALKEIPISDVLRERLSLALDQMSGLERKNEESQRSVVRVELQLELEKAEHKKTADELRLLQATWAEEVRILHCIEFRRGKRTGGKWLAFCPKCHLPVKGDGENINCNGCEWSLDEGRDMQWFIGQIRD